MLVLARFAVPAALAAAVAAPLTNADVVNTAFSYQGRLIDGGEPANGLYDLTFELHDDPVLGVQQGLSVVLGAVAVTEGLFTVELDFGNHYNQSQALWLQVEVRPAGGGAYTTLVPRQELTGVPYALGLRLPFLGEWAQNGAALAITNPHDSGTAIHGEHASASGVFPGIYGVSNSQSAEAKGVHGLISDTAPGALSAGVRGENLGTGGGGTGVWGSHNGSGYGVYGESPGGYGVFGDSDTSYGVYARSNTNHGLRAFSVSGNAVFATTGGPIGVYGQTSSQDANAFGVHGYVSSTSPGSYSAGVRGENNGNGGNGIGVWGSHDGSGWGVLGESPDGVGVYGSSTNGYAGYFGGNVAVTGTFSSNALSATTSDLIGVYGRTSSQDSSAFGVHGYVSSTSPGSYSAGVRGENNGNGALGIGVWGSHDGSGWGVLGESSSGVGVYGSSTSGYAGYFGGNVTVTGSLAKGGGSFKIDHPLDPTNKYLQHSFVESPDMMNIYNGNVRLDVDGTATVTMPEWFAALNADFRYQLTPIGGAAPNLHIARRIEDRSFTIAGGAPGLEVSWQVTGVRTDPYAEANRIQVEMDKPADERGTLMHPEAYGVIQPRTGLPQ